MIHREDVVAEIESELDEMFGKAPEQMAEAARESIKREFSEYAQRVVDSLSTEELQSEAAHQRFIENILAHARMRLYMR